MGQFKLLNLFKPAQRIIPDVPPPQERRVPFKCVTVRKVFTGFIILVNSDGQICGGFQSKLMYRSADCRLQSVGGRMSGDLDHGKILPSFC